VHVGARLLAVGGVVVAATALAYCNVYDSALLLPGGAESGTGDSGLDGPEGGGGIGWWSGSDGPDACFSAGVPTPADRPSPTDTATSKTIYLAITAMRLGSLDPNNKPSSTAWEDIGFDLDGVCTQSPTCVTSGDPQVSCKPTGIAVPVDGNYCRDNTFGRLEVKAAAIPQVGGMYGLNDDAFDCALCVGDYNYLIRISNYNGTPDDDQVRVDLYPSPGLENPLPWSCSSPDWRNEICFTPDMPFTVRDTAVATAQGGPSLPDAVVNDPHAYVRGGYIVAQLPPNTLFWFPGYNAPATAFPLAFAQALVAGHLTTAQDGTWTISDGTIGGRATEQDILNGFQLIGFCPSNDATDYALMQSYLHANLDILASGKVDPNATCDSVSVGIGFTAGQATAGKLVHIPDPVACTPKGQGGDGGAGEGGEGGTTDAGPG
jgi:hypothetical protein